MGQGRRAPIERSRGATVKEVAGDPGMAPHIEKLTRRRCILQNSTSFKKGELRRRQGQRGPGKVTSAARQAIMEVVDGNSHRLQQWLDDVAERDGPAAALAIYVKMLEFAVPKLARQELVGDVAEPQELIVRWLPSTN